MSFIRSSEPDDPTQAIEEAIADYRLPGIDAPEASARPTGIDEFYSEQELQLRAEEQVLLHRAEGGVDARPFETIVGRLDAQVDDEQSRIDCHRTIVEGKQVQMGLAEEALVPHVRRPHNAHKTFLAHKSLIFLGDVVGVTASLINFGLLPWMAAVQGLSIGGAVLALGQVGTEIKYMQRVRELARPADELTESESQFPGVFDGQTAGESIAKIVFYSTLAAFCLIFGGVLSVQWATDGLAAGLFFGCLGAAIGLASAVNYWAYADHVADIVDNARADFAEADAELAKLCDSELRRQRDEAKAEASSIREEAELRAEAAKIHMLALDKLVLRNNPGVAGHGTAAAKHPQLGRVHSNGHTSQEVTS